MSTEPTDKPTSDVKPDADPKTGGVTIPDEVVEALHKKAIEAAKVEADRVAKEAVESQNKRIRAAIGDTPQVDPREKFFENFLADPINAFLATSEKAKEEAKRELRTELAQERQAERAKQQAVAEVIGPRPDIGSSESARKLISTLWTQQDENLPPAEQLKLAVRAYDLMMEENGLGDAESRVKAAASPTKTASATPGGDKPGSDWRARQEASLEKFRQSRVDEYRKKHGDQYPGSIRR